MMLAAHGTVTLRHHIERTFDFVAYGAACTGAARDRHIAARDRLRRVRLGEGGEQKLDEFRIPHLLARTIIRHVWRLQTGENHRAACIRMPQRE
jgi:hypothetical protein